jgi:hypothetical protein
VNRITDRIAALTTTTAVLLLTVAGSASAGGYDGDDRCKSPEGVVVVCTADEVVDLDELDLDVLNILDHHHR